LVVPHIVYKIAYESSAELAELRQLNDDDAYTPADKGLSSVLRAIQKTLPLSSSFPDPRAADEHGNKQRFTS
jgi:hypothetical protein